MCASGLPSAGREPGHVERGREMTKLAAAGAAQMASIAIGWPNRIPWHVAGERSGCSEPTLCRHAHQGCMEYIA